METAQKNGSATSKNLGDLAFLISDAASDEIWRSSHIVDEAAGQIAIEMGTMHGGRWQTQIDHQRRVVMIWSVD